MIRRAASDPGAALGLVEHELIENRTTGVPLVRDHECDAYGREPEGHPPLVLRGCLAIRTQPYAHQRREPEVPERRSRQKQHAQGQKPEPRIASAEQEDAEATDKTVAEQRGFPERRGYALDVAGHLVGELTDAQVRIDDLARPRQVPRRTPPAGRGRARRRMRGPRPRRATPSAAHRRARPPAPPRSRTRRDSAPGRTPG